jgi:hypothetical protein
VEFELSVLAYIQKIVEGILACKGWLLWARGSMVEALCYKLEGHGIFSIFIIRSGVRLSPLGTAATIGLLYQPQMIGTAVTIGLLYQPQMIDDGDCGTTGGMKIGRGNRSTLRKPALVPL